MNKKDALLKEAMEFELADVEGLAELSEKDLEELVAERKKEQEAKALTPKQKVVQEAVDLGLGSAESLNKMTEKQVKALISEKNEVAAPVEKKAVSKGIFVTCRIKGRYQVGAKWKTEKESKEETEKFLAMGILEER